MEESIQTVRDYYDKNAHEEWARLEKHPFEFILTTYMMERYVRPGDSVLDIGGGPGRYAVHFAKMGCDVTLVDLSPANVALAKEKARAAGVALRAAAANCLDIGEMDLGAYDHVLLMGPLYHLVRAADRAEAVRLALSRLKPGGKFYGSFILAFAGFIYDLKNGPGLLPLDAENGAAEALTESVIRGARYDGPAFTAASLINQRQIEPFLAPFGLKKLAFFGQEGILAPNENQVLDYPEAERALWIETAKRLLEVPELLAYSEHAMYIGEK
jgi:SAM-dependent methyltransferase